MPQKATCNVWVIWITGSLRRERYQSMPYVIMLKLCTPGPNVPHNLIWVPGMGIFEKVWTCSLNPKSLQNGRKHFEHLNMYFSQISGEKGSTIKPFSQCSSERNDEFEMNQQNEKWKQKSSTWKVCSYPWWIPSEGKDPIEWRHQKKNENWPW